MKKLFLLLTISLIFSCSDNQKTENQFQYFIDVDINADYKNYFEKLSNEYKDALKIKYQSPDLKIVFDSVLNNRRDIHNSIISKKIVVENFAIDSFTTNENINVIKYRANIHDTRQNAQIFKERVLLEYIQDGEKKYTPYDPKWTPQLDSILNNKVTLSTIEKANDFLKFKEYEDSQADFQTTKNIFKEYIANFRSNNLKLLDFIYPPILENLLANNGQTEFTQEQKLELVEYIKKGRDSQELNFTQFLIDNFTKIDCFSDKRSYILDYVIDVENNLYISGKIIVIIENEKTYFIEADLNDIKENFSNIFDKEFINCVENAYE